MILKNCFENINWIYLKFNHGTQQSCSNHQTNPYAIEYQNNSESWKSADTEMQLCWTVWIVHVADNKRRWAWKNNRRWLNIILVISILNNFRNTSYLGYHTNTNTLSLFADVLNFLKCKYSSLFVSLWRWFDMLQGGH